MANESIPSGEQPAVNPAPTPEVQVVTPVATPEVKGDANSAPAEQEVTGAQPTNGNSRTTLASRLPENATADDIVNAFTPEEVAAMDSADINALFSKDSQAVARVLKKLGINDKEPEAPKPAAEVTPKPETAAVEEQPATTPKPKTGEEDEGPGRISLRRLSPKDRKAFAEIVQAVADGKYASIDEARKAMQPETAPAAPANQEQAQPEVPAAVKAAQDKVAAIKQKLAEASDAFDRKNELALMEELADAKSDLRDVTRAEEAQREFIAEFSRAEAPHIAAVAVSKEFQDPVFKQAFADERVLAEHYGDPVMQRPDWASELAKRVKEKQPKPAAQAETPAAPVTPAAPARQPVPAAKPAPKGAVAAPSNGRGPAISLDEALAQIETLPEAEVDKVLALMREKENASKFQRRAA